MKWNVKRIKPAKFYLGRYVLNEYEVRQMQLETLQGIREPGITFRDDGVESIILEDGRLSRVPKGFGLASEITLAMIRWRREHPSDHDFG